MLTFKQAIETALKRRLSISGRSCRSEFWWLYLASIPCFIVATYIARMGGLFSILGLIVSLSAFVLVIACMVRRLHDMNLSALLVLLIFIPTFGILILLVICAFKGSKGINKYGPDPLEDDYLSKERTFFNNQRQNASNAEQSIRDFERKIRGFYNKDNDDDHDDGFRFKP